MSKRQALYNISNKAADKENSSRNQQGNTTTTTAIPILKRKHPVKANADLSSLAEQTESEPTAKRTFIDETNLLEKRLSAIKVSANSELGKVKEQIKERDEKIHAFNVQIEELQEKTDQSINFLLGVIESLRDKEAKLEQKIHSLDESLAQSMKRCNNQIQLNTKITLKNWRLLAAKP